MFSISQNRLKRGRTERCARVWACGSMVEQRPLKPTVGGSTPLRPTDAESSTRFDRNLMEGKPVRDRRGLLIRWVLKHGLSFEYSAFRQKGM